MTTPMEQVNKFVDNIMGAIKSERVMNAANDMTDVLEDGNLSMSEGISALLFIIAAHVADGDQTIIDRKAHLATACAICINRMVEDILRREDA